MKTKIDLDRSWLNGKYNFGHKITGEINIRLSYVSVDSEINFFDQGENAENIVEEIRQIWLSDGRRTTKTAFKKWINIYL